MVVILSVASEVGFGEILNASVASAGMASIS